MKGGSVRVEPATTDLVTVVADEVGAHVPAASARSLRLVLEAPRLPILVDIPASVVPAFSFASHGVVCAEGIDACYACDGC